MGQRRKREKAADRKKVVQPGTGPWSPEVVPLKKPFLVGRRWLMLVILITQKTEIRRIAV
jgi:hypothetical protein